MKKAWTAAMRKATFAAGCFWGVEARFQRMRGVVSTRVGYTGGWLENPQYEEVPLHAVKQIRLKSGHEH